MRRIYAREAQQRRCSDVEAQTPANIRCVMIWREKEVAASDSERGGKCRAQRSAARSTTRERDASAKMSRHAMLIRRQRGEFMRRAARCASQLFTLMITPVRPSRHLLRENCLRRTHAFDIQPNRRPDDVLPKSVLRHVASSEYVGRPTTFSAATRYPSVQ